MTNFLVFSKFWWNYFLMIYSFSCLCTIFICSFPKFLSKTDHFIVYRKEEEHKWNLILKILFQVKHFYCVVFLLFLFYTFKHKNNNQKQGKPCDVSTTYQNVYICIFCKNSECFRCLCIIIIITLWSYTRIGEYIKYNLPSFGWLIFYTLFFNIMLLSNVSPILNCFSDPSFILLLLIAYIL